MRQSHLQSARAADAALSGPSLSPKAVQDSSRPALYNAAWSDCAGCRPSTIACTPEVADRAAALAPFNLRAGVKQRFKGVRGRLQLFEISGGQQFCIDE